MVYITLHDAQALKKWKYAGGAYTPLDDVLDYYWRFCARLMPDWLAPNAITLAGFLFFLGCLIFLLLCSALRLVPWYNFACLLCSFSMWMYMTLDAVDGKQARRLGMSSAMGSIMDHGCDSMAMFFNGIAVVVALDMEGGLAREPIMLLCFTCCMSSFWLPQWEHFYRGSLVHGGVTEGQLAGMSFPFLAGLLGWNVMHNPLSSILPPNVTAEKAQWFQPLVDQGLYRLVSPQDRCIRPLSTFAFVYPCCLCVLCLGRVALLGKGIDPVVTLFPFFAHLGGTYALAHFGILQRIGTPLYLLLGCQFCIASLRWVVRNAVYVRTSPLMESGPFVTLIVFVAFGAGYLPQEHEATFAWAYFGLYQVPRLLLHIADTAQKVKAVLKLPYLTVPNRKNK